MVDMLSVSTHICEADVFLDSGFMWEKLLLFTQGFDPIEATPGNENKHTEQLYTLERGVRNDAPFPVHSTVVSPYPSSLACPFIFWSSMLISDVVTFGELGDVLLLGLLQTFRWQEGNAWKAFDIGWRRFSTHVPHIPLNLVHWRYRLYIVQDSKQLSSSSNLLLYSGRCDTSA